MEKEQATTNYKIQGMAEKNQTKRQVHIPGEKSPVLRLTKDDEAMNAFCKHDYTRDCSTAKESNP